MADYLDVALDDGPGGFAPRKDLASPEAIVRLHALEVAARRGRPPELMRKPRDPKKKAKRKAARAARRRTR